MTQKQIYCKIARKDTSTLSRIRNVVEISHKNERLGLSETQLDVNHIQIVCHVYLRKAACQKFIIINIFYIFNIYSLLHKQTNFQV